MTRIRGLLWLPVAFAVSSSPAQDLPGLGEVRPEIPRPRVGRPDDPPPPIKELLERLDSALAAAAETRKELGEAPVNAPAADPPPKPVTQPLKLVPQEMNLGRAYLGRPGADGQTRYLAIRVWLVNDAPEPVTVRREDVRLTVRGREIAAEPPQKALGPARIALGRRPIDLAEIAKTGPVTIPAGEAVGLTVAFFDIPGAADVPPMTLRLSAAGQPPAELDLNAYALGLMRVGVERFGPRGLLGLVTIRGEMTPVGAGGLVEVLEKLMADGASRAVIAWDAAAPPVSPDLSNWLVQAATRPGGAPLNDGQHPALPPLQETHLAAIPRGTGVPSLAGPSHVHETAAEAVVAAVGSAYESLPVADLLREIEAGHPLTRPAAVAAGGRLPDDKLPMLIGLTGDADPAIATAAVRALRGFGTDEAVARLVALAKAGPEPVRFAAVESLAASRYAAAHQALRALLDASADGSPVVPPEALVPVLAEYPRALWGDALYRLATTGDAAVRSEALTALARQGHPDLVRAFESALAAENDRLRTVAFRLVARRRDAASEDLALRFTLRHLETQPPNRQMAELLTRTKDPRAVPLLLKQLEAGGANRSDLVRLLSQAGGLEIRGAIEAAYPRLDRAGQVQSLAVLAQMRSPKFYDFAAAALRSNDPSLINAATHQLQADGGPEAVGLLAAMLSESTQPVILTNAANGLASIGTPEARAALRKAAHSDVEARATVASSAWWQLQRQGPGFDSFLAGRAAAQQEDWKVAAERQTDAVELDPQLVDAWAARANAHMQLADYAAARADYERTLALDPYDAAAVTCLGILRVFDGDVDEGLAFVRERAAGFEKNNLFAYNSACLYSVAADRVEKADAARAERLRTDAVKELSRAVALGMTTPAEVDWMKKDPDLKGLRGRPDFNQVVAEGETAAKARPADEAGE